MAVVVAARNLRDALDTSTAPVPEVNALSWALTSFDETFRCPAQWAHHDSRNGELSQPCRLRLGHGGPHG
jgi:hypothetical protein